MAETARLEPHTTIRAVRVVDNEDGFASWYAREHPRLLAVMTIVAGDVHVAQDVTSEAFARALASWTRVGEMEAPAGWTYRVALNVYRRRARRAALEQRLLFRHTREPSLPDPADL